MLFDVAGDARTRTIRMSSSPSSLDASCADAVDDDGPNRRRRGVL